MKDFISLRFNFSFNWQSSTANLFSLSLFLFFILFSFEVDEITSRWMAGIVSSISRDIVIRAQRRRRLLVGGVSSLGGLRVISGPNRAAISGGKAGSGQTNVIPLEFKISLINTPRNEWYTSSFFLRWVIFFHVCFLIAQSETDLRNICRSFVTD